MNRNNGMVSYTNDYDSGREWTAEISADWEVISFYPVDDVQGSESFKVPAKVVLALRELLR